MNIDRDLQAAMEQALVARADGGPNADPPLAERRVPRVSAVTSMDPLAIKRYMEGANKAPMDVSYAANVETGKAVETMILGVVESAMRSTDPDFAWDLFPQEDGTLGWQPPRMICGPAIGRPDAMRIIDGLLCDAKSASATQFAMILKDGGEQYRVQQTLYVAGAEAKYNRPFRSLVAVMNKETKKGTPQAFAVFEFGPDPALVEKVTAAVEQSKGDAKCPYIGTDWHNRYCAYRDTPGCGGRP